MSVSLSQLFAAPPPADDADSLSKIFEEEPVPLDVFINDKKYLGQGNVSLSRVQSDAIKHIERIYLPQLYIRMAAEFGGYWEERIPVKNLITLQWGKGSGKDAVCRWASLRVAYMLLCLKSPQMYFGLPETDSIHLLNIASSTGQANRAFFKPMTEAVKRGWFKDRAEPKQGLIQYAKNIEAVSGHSDAEGQEGLNLMLGVADEIDAFKAKGEMIGQGNKLREASTSAESILEMLKTSASSRFPESYKRVAISYPRYKGSTIQILTREGHESQEKFGEKSIHFVSGPLATWQVNPRIKGKESFAEDYDKDPVGSAAKYECKPTRATDAYFRNMPLIRQAVDKDDQPIQVDYQLSTVRSQKTGDLVEVWEPVFTFHDSFQPIQGARYAMHGDLAIRGDRAGIAMSHIERWDEQTEKVIDADGNESSLVARVPIVRNDFTIGLEADLTAKPPREIQVRWARKLAFELMSKGFPVVRFTFDGFQCLSGDTRIPLLDGTSPTMRELEGRENFWVYSIKDGRVVPGLAKRAWRTGFREDMVEVELDNGEKIRATGDHRFMLRDGSYRMAADLTPGDSLMPLYRRMRKVSPTSAEYEQVWHPEADGSGKRWRFTHSMVSHAIYGKLPKGSVTHHIDHSKTNNSPENLIQLTNEEHYEWHTSALNSENGHPFANAWANDEWREAHKARLAEHRRRDQLGRRGTETKRYRHDLTFERVVDVHSRLIEQGLTPTRALIQKALGCSQDALYARIRAAGFRSWKHYRDETEGVSEWNQYQRKYKKIRSANNHKVVAVRPSVAEDVYDIEVEKFHNFATEAGVFVHNSADSIQLLNAHGIESKRVSADINDDVWKILRDLAYSGRLRMPDSQLLFTELDALSKVGGGKVDHPPQGSKDLADAFACSLLGALESGGEEDAEGKSVELGESLFKIGSSTMDLAGVETMSELFGDPLGLPFGMNEMGFYGYQ